ncbi:MAG: molybdopterin-dependent oxidoreductase [Acidimicrobiales bacterium]
MTKRRWVRVCSLGELEPGRGIAALVGEEQVAVFLLDRVEEPTGVRLRGVDNRDPVTGTNVLARGILGSTGDVDYVASPMHKHRFDLASGRCLDGTSPGVRVWPVRVWGATVEVLAVTDATATDASATPTAPTVSATDALDTDASDISTTPTATHCPYCALQCGMALQTVPGSATGGDQRLEVIADPTFPVNRGRMCVKGWSSVELLAHPDRLLQPLVRDAGGHLRGATWDAALDELAGRLSTLRNEHGADAVGVFGSGALTNEKAYLLGKFARVALGTANIDYNGRYCMSSAAAAQNMAFGLDRGMPFPVSDIAETDVLVLWGSNCADTMPPIMQWLDRQRACGGRLIVVDPRSTATAQIADLHLQPVPGSDLAVANGLLHLAVAEGLIDTDYIEARTTGWDQVRHSVRDWTPAQVQRVAGIPERALRQTVEAIAGATASMLLSGRGPEQQSKGTDSVLALINLMLAMGKVGRPASGYGCITGQGNGQGGREHGQKADQLPGYRSITDGADRAAIARVWNVHPDTLPGAGNSAVDMIESIGSDGGLRGLVVAGSNLAVASPDARRVAERLGRLDCLAVLDSFANDTTALAHVVLPVAQWAEEDGTVTNLEGRVIRRRGACRPPPGVRTDIEVLCGLAERLGQAAGFRFSGPEEVFAELRAASAGGRADYAGISYDRIDSSHGVFWPCPTNDHPGTPRLFTERFAHPNGRARFVPVAYRPAAEAPDSDYPLYFTTGRYREHYNSGAQTRRVGRLQQARPEPRLQLHPILAKSLMLSDDGMVEVESRRGKACFKAHIDAGIRPDTVFAPLHWDGSQAANLITIAALDPISRMPEFKVCAVRIKRQS